jgi:mannose-6-phosphate isomerase-like protein (cupin superfamily)
MNLFFSPQTKKNIVFENVEKYLDELNFSISKKDVERPWGGFFVIDEDQSQLFVKNYFSSFDGTFLLNGNRISPKILVVAPGKRLSWQYHFRRAELWKVIGGEVGVVKSETDKENEMKNYQLNSIIPLKNGERHRLIGLNAWGIVAEIWQHTDKNNPSDEDDIIRLKDDFGR